MSHTMPHSSKLIISLRKIAENYRRLQASTAAECACAVKANGYGLGGVEVSSAVINAGAKTLFVAHLKEGIEIRAAFPHIKIYILNGLPKGSNQEFINYNLTPVLGSRDEIAEWGKPYALMVDTGMNRLGVTLEDAINAPSPELIMSHFACADVPLHPLNVLQIERFNHVRAHFPKVKASLANSDGMAFTNAHYDMTRIGIALYEDAVTLQASVIQSRLVTKGEAIGYGATYVAHEDMPIALVNLGYADGYLRAGEGGVALYNGKRVPILGRISMDILAVGCAAQRGESLTFLGEGLSQKEVAGHMNTISYELLTRLGARFERQYR